MRAYVGPLLLALVSLVSLNGCLSGQTGSPDCVGPTSCICDPLYTYGTLARVSAESFESGRLEVTVQQAFTAPEAGPSDLMQGDRLAGSLDTQQPCDRGVAPSIAPGAELLVLYSAGHDGDYPNCSDFHACANADCSGLEEPALSECWTSCELQTAEVCASHRSAALLDGYFSWAVPWQQTLDFGASHQLSTSELDVLTSPDACHEHFPLEPAPPCDDTPSSMQCAAAGHPRGGSAAGWLVLVIGLTLTGVLRRRAERLAPTSSASVRRRAAAARVQGSKSGRGSFESRYRSH